MTVRFISILGLLFFINNATAQNVGIGTSSPIYKLDVRGTSADNGAILSVGNADASHKIGLFGGRLNDPNPFILWKAGDPLRFATDLNGFSELMRIMPNGNVGIGTTTPTLAKLQVQGMVGNTVAMFSDIATLQGISLVADYPGVYFNSYWDNGLRSMTASGYSSFIETDQTNGTLTFNVAATANTAVNSLIIVPERMRITTGGQVSIGGSAPAASAILDVSSATKGFLPPRMTAAQRTAIAAPADGLMVYQTDAAAGYYFYKEAAWTKLSETTTLTSTGAMPIVSICCQSWMTQNLDVDKYRNGDPIPKVTDNAAWDALTTGAYCYYNNDSATYAAVFGKLYNWYAVNDPRGLAPEGWHVPTDFEWTTLENCLGGSTVAGGFMKETGLTYWMPPNGGATNTSGFKGRPGGFRGNLGSFANFGYACIWWSATENDATTALFRSLGYYYASTTRDYNDKQYGYSVRCIRN